MTHQLNMQITTRLRAMSNLLDHHGDTGFRSQAYRRAANVIEALDQPVDQILNQRGRKGLLELPAIGEGIASAIAEMAVTGRWSALDHLEGETDPEALLMTVPGIGPRLAERMHMELHIDTLEELECAIADGRLAGIGGFGPRRLGALHAAVRERLQLLRGRPREGEIPRVGTLLDIDAEYRGRAERGELKLIAPRRFNPKGLPWLPVMHAHRPPWHFTALYSNTARAHQLNKSHDWVVIAATHDNQPDWQCTVVTETRGALKGRRVVRGMEKECETYYAAAAAG